MYVYLFQIIAFDELKTDYKNPIDQCNSLNPVGSIKTFTMTYFCKLLAFIQKFIFIQLFCMLYSL